MVPSLITRANDGKIPSRETLMGSCYTFRVYNRERHGENCNA